MTVKLGLVDSGVSKNQSKYIHKSMSNDQQPDLLGHGTAVCDVILHYAPTVALYNAQVFDERRVTTAAAIAAALDWLTAEKVDLINLSLGLRHDRPILKDAVDRALSAGIILIASSPAQGAAVYPSSYAGVMRATGDARCDLGEVSYLHSSQADFGGCPRGVTKKAAAIGGASMGAAHISGRATEFLQEGGDGESLGEWLVSQAKYVHNEHRVK